MAPSVKFVNAGLCDAVPTHLHIGLLRRGQAQWTGHCLYEEGRGRGTRAICIIIQSFVAVAHEAIPRLV